MLFGFKPLCFQILMTLCPPLADRYRKFVGTRLWRRHVVTVVRICPVLLQFTVCSEKDTAILMNTEVWNQGFCVKIEVIYWVFTICQAPCKVLLVPFFSVSNLFWNFALTLWEQCMWILSICVSPETSLE